MMEWFPICPTFSIMLDTLLFKMMVLAKHYPLANSYNAIVLKALKHRFKKREVRFIRTYLIILLNSLLLLTLLGLVSKEGKCLPKNYVSIKLGYGPVPSLSLATDLTELTGNK